MQTGSLHKFCLRLHINLFNTNCHANVVQLFPRVKQWGNKFFFNILRECNKLLDHCILSPWFATELNLAETNLYERHNFWKALPSSLFMSQFCLISGYIT